jgi:hypothetical protein
MKTKSWIAIWRFLRFSGRLYKISAEVVEMGENLTQAEMDQKIQEVRRIADQITDRLRDSGGRDLRAENLTFFSSVPFHLITNWGPDIADQAQRNAIRHSGRPYRVYFKPKKSGDYIFEILLYGSLIGHITLHNPERGINSAKGAYHIQNEVGGTMRAIIETKHDRYPEFYVDVTFHTVSREPRKDVRNIGQDIFDGVVYYINKFFESNPYRWQGGKRRATRRANRKSKKTRKSRQ